MDAISESFPERPFEYHKAVKEMLHRYFASGLGLLIVVLAGLAIRNRRAREQPVALPVALVALVILQGLLGMWTVTLLLKPLIVVLHLLGGLLTLSLLCWLAIEPNRRTLSKDESGMRSLAAVGLALVALQIALGGWTSSNYAALACPDFPLCQNAVVPQMDIKNAFVLWRGLGIDYEGGVLDHPARVAIHFAHRVGALITAAFLGFLTLRVWRKARNPSVRLAGALIGTLLLLQLVVGPLMVMRGLPLGLATAHNAVAALLLISLVRLKRLLQPLAPRY
jgi:cytochrome c oxidase assembly protein subunit 15